jgi:hypothetical protein
MKSDEGGRPAEERSRRLAWTALLPTWDGKTSDGRVISLGRALRPARRRSWCRAGEGIPNAGRCQERDGKAGGDGNPKSRWKERPNPYQT